MNELMMFLPAANSQSALPTFDIPIIAILQAFSVVVGAALTRFFVEPRMVDAQSFKRPWHRELFYWSALTILITLAVRFLVGSGVHLRMVYAVPEILQHESLTQALHRFLKDLFFLFAFGAFLVRAALARNIRSFTKWLMMFSGIGLIWSLIELFYPDRLRKAWLFINLCQFAVTFLCWLFSPKEETKEEESAKEENTNKGLTIVIILTAVFVALFCIDIWHIVESSPGWFGRIFFMK